jgi:hypothetical protein
MEKSLGLKNWIRNYLRKGGGSDIPLKGIMDKGYMLTISIIVKGDA